MFHTANITLHVEPDGKVDVRSIPPNDKGDTHVVLRHRAGSDATMAFYGEPFAVAAVIDLLACAAQQQVPGYADACRTLGLDPTTDLSRGQRVAVWDEVERLRTQAAADMVRRLDELDAADDGYDTRAQQADDADETHAAAVAAGAAFMEASPQQAVR